MKRIVDGVAYNTETSTLLARKEDVDEAFGGNPEREWRRELYQTRGGAFFLVHNEAWDQWNQAAEEMQRRTRVTFEPVSPDLARKWLIEGEVEVFTNPFDEPPEAEAEDDPAATIYVRVPAALKREIEDAAKAAGQSANAFALRCFENCVKRSKVVKQKIKLSELKSKLLEQVRVYDRSCADVQEIHVDRISDDRVDFNWAPKGYRVGPDTDKAAVERALKTIAPKLQADFDLVD